MRNNTVGEVLTNLTDASRFNGFNARGKPLKRLGFSLDAGHLAEAGCELESIVEVDAAHGDGAQRVEARGRRFTGMSLSSG